MQVQLIDDLLDVSRIVTGNLNMEFQPVDLATVVARAVDGLSLAIERKSLKLEMVAAESIGLVQGDEMRLQQIATNLLTNAIKFTPKLGTVSVSLATADGSAVLTVKDTGTGIDPAFLPDVFNRFTQENSTSTRSHGGLGLGLAIVQHLVDLHLGTVTAESAGSGKGATFTVTLPLMKAPRDAVPRLKARVERASVDPAALNGLRILVTDDDRATREAIADMLEQMGADVRLARSAADAMSGDRGVSPRAPALRHRDARRGRLRVHSQAARACAAGRRGPSRRSPSRRWPATKIASRRWLRASRCIWPSRSTSIA